QGYAFKSSISASSSLFSSADKPTLLALACRFSICFSTHWAIILSSESKNISSWLSSSSGISQLARRDRSASFWLLRQCSNNWPVLIWGCAWHLSSTSANKLRPGMDKSLTEERSGTI
ncbi:putative lipoprotein, partial [Vibrio parahaemolyticus VPTS-2010]